MCGIAGILTSSPAIGRHEPLRADWIDILDNGIKHRGPDGRGRFTQWTATKELNRVHVALIHRRLSILDDSGGAQPMVHELNTDDAERPGTVAVVFNGCIYNHRDLRRELLAKGARFTSDHSDTEVLIHGWREWGSQLFERLEGMYAVAIWDENDANLTLARDPAGEKPLYLLRLGNLLAFASSAAALIALAARNDLGLPHPDPMAVGQWLAWGFANTAGLCGIKELPPNSVWDWRHEWTHPAKSFLDSEHFEPRRDRPLTLVHAESLLEQAVASRLDADVPLGAFLSGGTDSSLISLFARRAHGSLNTFCVAMPGDSDTSGADESALAAQAAAIIGSNHTTLTYASDPAQDLLHLIPQMGLPFGDSSLLPTYWVSKAARQHVKVALSGDGGDELFCGYQRQVAAAHLTRYRAFLRAAPYQLLEGSLRGKLLAKVERLLAAAKGIGYPEIAAIFHHIQLQELIGPQAQAVFAKALDSWEHTLSYTAPEWDFFNYLPGDLLRKVDTASMSVPLEVRAPFLDSRLIEACLRAPLSDLMPGNSRKGLLRAIARRHFPAALIDRPKQGFSIPLAAWFRNDYGGLRRLLLDSVLSTEAFPENLLGIAINRRFIEKMIDEHMRCRRDHSQRLYILMVLAIWVRWYQDCGRAV